MEFLILILLICAFIGWHLGGHRGGRGEGLVLGLAFGPLGLLALWAFRPRLTPGQLEARR